MTRWPRLPTRTCLLRTATTRRPAAARLLSARTSPVDGAVVTSAVDGARYAFLFMRASGAQLDVITKLIDTNVLRPIADRAYPFDDAPQALAHVESGRTKGKVVIAMAHPLSLSRTGGSIATTSDAVTSAGRLVPVGGW